MSLTRKQIANPASSKTKKRNSANRPSPSESAGSLSEGIIKRGNNGQDWVIKKASNGIQRWVLLANGPDIDGIMPLTVDYLAKHIGKPVIIYETEYVGRYPTRAEFRASWKFTPSGDAKVGSNKLLAGWLRKQKPSIPDRVVFSVMGTGANNLPLQVDSINKKLASSNIMNMQAWVKV